MSICPDVLLYWHSLERKEDVLKYIASILLAFILITSGCVTTSKVDYPNYRLAHNEFENFSLNKSVYVAPIEQLSTRIYNFKEVYAVIQVEIESYMQQNGFDILSSEKCEGAFIHNMSKIGGFFDQRTGKMDSKLLQKCIHDTIKKLKMTSNFSAIIIPFLVFSPLNLQKPYISGTWDGVKRKVKNSSNSGVSFSPIQTMTVKLIVLSNNGALIFESSGGIDFIQKVKEVGSMYEGRVALVSNKSDEFSLEDIREGVEIAFHPFIFCQRIGDAKESYK